jgi:hypothetical protein
MSDENETIRQLLADIAERDARISDYREQLARLLDELADAIDVRMCIDGAPTALGLVMADRDALRAELARLRAQTPIATVCLITDRFAHDNITEAQLQIDPAAQLPIGTKLYAEPMPAKVAK